MTMRWIAGPVHARQLGATQNKHLRLRRLPVVRFRFLGAFSFSTGCRNELSGIEISQTQRGCTMIKQTKFFRKQADKAERMARAVPDLEAAQGLSALADAYQSQADMLKKSKKKKRDIELVWSSL
jgi:hypothetical protein